MILKEAITPCGSTYTIRWSTCLAAVLHRHAVLSSSIGHPNGTYFSCLFFFSILIAIPSIYYILYIVFLYWHGIVTPNGLVLGPSCWPVQRIGIKWHINAFACKTHLYNFQDAVHFSEWNNSYVKFSACVTWFEGETRHYLCLVLTGSPLCWVPTKFIEGIIIHPSENWLPSQKWWIGTERKTILQEVKYLHCCTQTEVLELSGMGHSENGLVRRTRTVFL